MMNLSLKKIIEEKFTKPGKALDLGAGSFADVKALKALGWDCEGVDTETGVNLENVYISKNRPYDLIFSNFLIHKLTGRINLIRTSYENLKHGGLFFFQTFDETDRVSIRGINSKEFERDLLNQGFKNVVIKVFDSWDDDDGHNHWHRILEGHATK